MFCPEDLRIALGSEEGGKDGEFHELEEEEEKEAID